MASGWNLSVWLECIGWLVCVVAWRYTDILILITPTPFVLASSFFVAEFLLLCSFFNVFLFLFVIFVQYSKRFAKNIRDRSKI